ncbi:hypothetical protein [Stenomitos frigidus]|uniref:Uncharacterized protein n=1 Tax=Stenomitos frigidus ULC18 TaxID=2107698 RepID=A0A2T1EA70_9CYAN|nr:hypothetical protein [Stenomitos frigidus]PSB29647.1 hypothetical protein C7B82_10820 [Stenomitos frigidus ULC18]
MAVESSFNVPDVPDTVSFAAAIALTQTLLDGLNQGSVTGAALESTVRALVGSENGARGFFVTYLSDDRPLADQPARAIIVALQASPAIVAPLLVKNLVMSTAMAITHRRNQDETMAMGSERVRSRTAQLIQRLHLPQVQAEAEQLSRAIATKTGAYQTFLERWGYDSEQRQAMQQALEETGIVERASRPEPMS